MARKAFSDLLIDSFAGELRKGIARVGAAVVRDVGGRVSELADGLEREGACSCTPSLVETAKGAYLVHQKGCKARD